jgi:hypothetical protein
MLIECSTSPNFNFLDLKAKNIDNPKLTKKLQNPIKNTVTKETQKCTGL